MKQVSLKNFGINVMAERKRKCLSQEELAELADISRNYLSLIESGKGNPSLNVLGALSEALEVDTMVLLKDVF